MKLKTVNHAPINNPLQRFARYEFKYFLNKNLRDAIEKEVRYFMEYDGYTHRELHNSYIVRSLYFDNFISSNFNEKVDGIKKRSKYRIRTYSQNESTNVPIFLEKKGRVNERTYKVRTEIKAQHLNDFSKPEHYEIILKNYKDNELVLEFVFDTIRKKLKPKVLVDYIRRPYTNKYGLYFRLTFDSNISAVLSNNLFLGENSNYFQKCRAGYTILEVKFDRSIPPWFHRIIQNYNLHRLSISKFVMGMEQCGIAEDI